jgi:Na+-transporting methylmalonyl-CoA/oxaloacetate decarboxylase gamma subunit
MTESIIAAANTASGSTSSDGAGLVFLFVGLLLYFMPTILALVWAFTTPAPAQPTTVYIQEPDGTLEAMQAPIGVTLPKKLSPQIFRL